MMMSRTNGERQATDWQAARAGGILYAASALSHAVRHRGIVVFIRLCTWLFSPVRADMVTLSGRAGRSTIPVCALHLLPARAASFVFHRRSRVSTRRVNGAGKRPFADMAFRRSMARERASFERLYAKNAAFWQAREIYLCGQKGGLAAFLRAHRRCRCGDGAFAYGSVAGEPSSFSHGYLAARLLPAQQHTRRPADGRVGTTAGQRVASVWWRRQANQHAMPMMRAGLPWHLPGAVDIRASV